MTDTATTTPTRYFHETFEIEPDSIATDLTPAQVGGVTRRLRNAAKEAGHSLGPTVIASDTHEIGVRRTVSAKAPIVGPYDIGADEGDEGRESESEEGEPDAD